MNTRSRHQNNAEAVTLVGGIGRREFTGSATCAVISLLASEGCAMAADDKATSADKHTKKLEELIGTYWVPGLAATRVTTEGVVVKAHAGLRKRKSSDKIGPDDRFHLGSNTKSMTSALAAMLVQEKKLIWETTVAEIFEPKNYEVDEKFGKATLKQLLSHRSGLAAISGTEPEWAKMYETEEPPEKAREEYARCFIKKSPTYEVGKHYEYSNEGYIVAGHMLEVVTGKPWETLMRDYLFTPLEMRSAGFGAPGGKEKVDEPRGHTSWWSAVEPGKEADNPAGLGPAGTVHSSLGDWGKFIAFMLRAAQGKEERLSKEQFEILTTPPDDIDDYALGWVTAERDWAGGKAIWHNGSNTMWYALAWLAPKKGFAALAACNQAGSWATSACDEAIGAMIDAEKS
jgi:CubicO group peptidase (beta-lactamase class C family)